MALRTIGIRLLAEVSAYKAGIKGAQDSTRSFMQELDKAARAGHLDAVASQATRMGLAAVGAFAAVEQAAARFEKQMSKVDAVTTTNAEGMYRLEQAALAAGKATQFSAIEAAQAEEELAKAGIGVNDILTGGLTGSLALAAAGSIDLAEAADVAAKTMNMFKLKGADVGHIADVLSASANKSATDVHELSMALKMGGLAASAAGMSLEETVATLSAFADRALVGSDAGTSLKSLLLFLQTPTEKATELMKQLGIEVYDAGGNFIGAAKLAGVLQRQLSGLTQEERNAALATIFGADAMRAANVLYNVGEKGVRDYIAAVDDQGAAQEAARKKTDNLIGDIERLRGSLETMAIESGSGANSGLRVLVQMLQGITDQFGRLPSEISGTVVILAGLTGAALLAGAAFIKFRTTAADVNKELIAMGPAGAKAAGALQTLTKWGGRTAGVFASLQIIGAIGSAMSGAAADANLLAAALKNVANSKATGEMERVFGGDLERLRSNLNFLKGGVENAQNAANIESMFGLSGFSFSNAKRLEEMKALDAALAQLASGGNSREAAAWFSRIADEAARQGVNLEQLRAIFPVYSQAATDAARAQNGLAAAHDLATANAAILEQGLAGLVKQTGSLTKAWQQLHGTQVGWAEAQIGVEEALDSLTESMKENGKAIDFDSEKGRNNQKAILGVVKSAVEAAQAKYDNTVATKGETAALQEANNVYNEYIARLRATLEKQGLSKQQVDDLIAAYARMPALVATRVDVTTAGVDAAISKMRQLQNMARDARLDFATRNRWGGVYEPQRWGGAIEHAQWGVLREAKVYSPQAPGRYMMAEPATGGELFVPKYGDKQRSLSLLNQGAGWYGATVVPTSQAAVINQTAAMAAAAQKPVKGETVVAVVYAKDGATQALAQLVDVRVERAMDREAAHAAGGPR